jgi:hypothetical protein
MALGGPREQQKHVPEVVAARHRVAIVSPLHIAYGVKFVFCTKCCVFQVVGHCRTF